MFFETIKSAWLAGQVRIDIHPDRMVKDIRIVAEGVYSLKANLLSQTERMKFYDLLLAESGESDRDLPLQQLRDWVESRRTVVITGRSACGKTTLAAAAFPDALILDGRTSDLTKPDWFWHQITKDPSRPLVIDEPAAFPPLVVQEIISIAKSQSRGYVLINQSVDDPRLDAVRPLMSQTGNWRLDDNIQLVELQRFDGKMAVAKWKATKRIAETQWPVERVPGPPLLE